MARTASGRRAHRTPQYEEEENEEDEQEDREEDLNGQEERRVFQTADGSPICFMLHKSLSPGQKKVLEERITVRLGFYVYSPTRSPMDILGTRRTGNGNAGQCGHYHRESQIGVHREVTASVWMFPKSRQQEDLYRTTKLRYDLYFAKPFPP